VSIGVKQYFKSILNGLALFQVSKSNRILKFPEIYKKYFHAVHVAIDQFPTLGLDMHLH
jgi:hypothetical protein